MSLPGGVYNVSYEQDMAIIRTKLQWGWLIAFPGLALPGAIFYVKLYNQYNYNLSHQYYCSTRP